MNTSKKLERILIVHEAKLLSLFIEPFSWLCIVKGSRKKKNYNTMSVSGNYGYIPEDNIERNIV